MAPSIFMRRREACRGETDFGVRNLGRSKFEIGKKTDSQHQMGIASLFLRKIMTITETFANYPRLGF